MLPEKSAENLRHQRLHGLDDALEVTENANMRNETHLTESTLEELRDIFFLNGVVADPPFSKHDSPTDAHERILRLQESYGKTVVGSRDDLRRRRNRRKATV